MSRSKSLRVGLERGGEIPPELARQRTRRAPGNRVCARSFLGLPHAAQIFPSTSSVSPTTIPSGWWSGSGRRRNRPSLKRYSPSSTPTHMLPARSSSMAATWFPGRPLRLPMEVTVPVSDAIERPAVCDPERAVSAGQNARRQILPQTLYSRVGDDTRIAEAVDAARGSSPDDAFAVFKQGPHRVAGKAVRLTVAFDSAATDTNDTCCIGAGPQTAVTIHHQTGHTDFASVKVRGHECFQDTVAQSLKPQSWSLLEQADPERSVGRAAETRYGGFDWIRLRHTTATPVNESRRSAQPQPAAAIGHYRNDVAKLNPVVLSETLDPAVAGRCRAARLVRVARPTQCPQDLR